MQAGWAQKTGASLKIIYEASYERNFRKYDQKAVLEIMRLAKTHCIQVLNIWWWWVGQKFKMVQENTLYHTCE